MNNPIRTVPAIAALALIAASLSAQTRPPASVNPSASDGPPAEVITLPEFNVTTTAATEYAATESTTGTRVVSRIRDLPFSVQSVTAEFMDDFGAYEFRDQLAFTSNVTGYETLSSGYSVRGFDADVQLRNGFRRIGLIDKVNIERAEVIKGPAASIYGAVFPGGTVNFVTRKPKTKPEQRLVLAGGGHDFYRAQFSTTGPLDGSRKLFYRIDAAADQRTFDQKFKEKNQTTASVQLLWKPSAPTSLLVEAEWLERRERGITSGSTVPFRIQAGAPDPYRVPAQNRTFNRYAAIATEILDFNSQGPHSYANRYVRNLTATFEHRLSDGLSLRSSANGFDRGLARQEAGSRDQFNPVTRTIQRGTARYRPFAEGGASLQNDLLASFATGGVKHKLLFTLDYQRQTQQPRQYDAAVNAAFPAAVATGLSVDNPDYNLATYLDNPALFTTVQSEDDSIDIYGAFLSERATLFDDRLNALVGLRYDSARNITRDKVANTRSEMTSHAVTHQVGLNFRVVPEVTAYANASASFVPQFGLGTNPDGSVFNLPNQKGRGWETGLKAGLLRDTLTFTAGYFDITLENIAATTTDSATGRTITVVSGQQTAKGYEFDFNWVATRELQFFGGYGYTDAHIARNDNAPHLNGTPTRRTPRNTVGLGAKYDFKDGRLKGVFLTAGFKHNDKSLSNPSAGRSLTASASNPIVNNPMPNGLLPFPNQPPGALVTSGSARVDDGRESIYNAPYDILDVGGGYKWKAGRHAHKAQVNVGNALDKRYTYGSSGQGDRRHLVFTYDLTF